MTWIRIILSIIHISIHYTIKGWLPTKVNFYVLYVALIIALFKIVLNPNHCTSELNPVFNSFSCATVCYSDFPTLPKNVLSKFA